MSDTDVFIISIVQHANPSEAIKEAIADAGINSARVQDVIFGLDEPRAIDTEKILSASGLTCSAATVSSSSARDFFCSAIHLELRRGCCDCRRHGNQRFDRVIVSFTGCGRQMEFFCHVRVSQRVR